MSDTPTPPPPPPPPLTTTSEPAEASADSPSTSSTPALNNSPATSAPWPVTDEREPSNPLPPSLPREPLSAYSCPICFSPPINATLTPCGHICCGSCLFTAVKTTARRAHTMMTDPSPCCPVCRAHIPGWDGKGGGVIGLTMRAVLSL